VVFTEVYEVQLKCGIVKLILASNVQNGCDFWHWKLDYVTYLLDNEYPTGGAAIEALGPDGGHEDGVGAEG
jgi:hypothetical protein